jgi:hypothetical protein
MLLKIAIAFKVIMIQEFFFAHVKNLIYLFIIFIKKIKKINTFEQKTNSPKFI